MAMLGDLVAVNFISVTSCREIHAWHHGVAVVNMASLSEENILLVQAYKLI